MNTHIVFFKILFDTDMEANISPGYEYIYYIYVYIIYN